MTARTQLHPIRARERSVLETLVQLHGDNGIGHEFDAATVALAHGSFCAGSLVGLTMQGLVRQRMRDQKVAYSVTEVGYATFAGLEGQRI